METISKRQLAEWIRAAIAVREESWNSKKDRYDKSWQRAVEEVVPDLDWCTIVHGLVCHEYCDYPDWADRILAD
jgi:hypothetical protein